MHTEVFVNRPLRTKRLLRFALLSLITVCLVPSLVKAESLPADHHRWTGTLEGSIVDDAGSGLVYDLVFKNDGTLDVDKLTTTNKVQQTFTWNYDGDDIQLKGDANGSIPEMKNARLTKVKDTRYILHLDTGVDVEVRRNKSLFTWLHLLFLFIVLMVTNELSRYFKVTAYLFYFVLPIVLIPLWLNAGFDGWFRWIKLYSAVAGGVLFTLFRFNGIDKSTAVKFAVMAVLGINIAEAVLQDFTQPALASQINAAAGILTIITMSRWKGIKRDESKPHDMLWPGMTTGWILAYDIWNIVFVYLNFPNTVGFSIIVLLAPTIAAVYIKKGTYLQARAYTLAIYMMYIFTLRRFGNETLDLSFTVVLPRSENISMGLALFSLAFALGYAILHFRWRITGKAPARIEVGQNESVI